VGSTGIIQVSQLVWHAIIIPAVRIPVSGYNYRMEFFAADPNLLRYPPAGTRLLDLIAKPDSDGKRSRVYLELTSFQQRPDIELNLADPAGNKIASGIIIEPVSWKLDLTLYIRKLSLTVDKFILTTGLIYPELGKVDRRVLIINNPIPAI
jgi:hypothetical protein